MKVNKRGLDRPIYKKNKKRHKEHKISSVFRMPTSAITERENINLAPQCGVSGTLEAYSAQILRFWEA